ncbi:MAG: prevent-host-death protein [Chloroflexi bacterium]|nr:MAG: prevent-host-death protein [Chloroflexota bacterium]
MWRTVEAVIDENGEIHLLEAVALKKKKHRALVTILDDAIADRLERPFGLSAGEFVVPDDFNDPLPEHILRDFEGV